MNEIERAKDIVKAFGLQDDPRYSALGRTLRAHEDSIELDTIEVYFNRNPRGEQIDLQVGDNVFNLAEWHEAEHKLSEMLLLKGASLDDLEHLHRLVLKQTTSRPYSNAR